MYNIENIGQGTQIYKLYHYGLY